MTRLVVLAAGVGSRLGSASGALPKCLVSLGGETILDRLLSQAEGAAELRDVVLVTGFRSDVLERQAAAWNAAHVLQVRCVRNADYPFTNTLVSAALGVADTPDASVLVDGDLVLDAGILARIAATQRSSFAVDSSRPLDPDAVKCELGGGRLRSISKELAPARAQAESLGLCHLDPHDVRWFRRVAAALLTAGSADAYYEAAFGHMLAGGWRPDVLDVAGQGWEEVDDADDLRRATALVALEREPSARGRR